MVPIRDHQLRCHAFKDRAHRVQANPSKLTRFRYTGSVCISGSWSFLRAVVFQGQPTQLTDPIRNIVLLLASSSQFVFTAIWLVVWRLARSICARVWWGRGTMCRSLMPSAEIHRKITLEFSLRHHPSTVV